MRKGKALYGGKADAQPRKTAGAGRHGQKRNILQGKAAGTQRLFTKGQQSFAVGKPGAQAAFIKKLTVPAQGHTCGFSGTIQP